METFQHGGHVHAEAPAQPFLQSIPPANGILRGSTPRFNRPFGRRLLLVRAPEKHPVAARLEHRMQVVDAPKVIPELVLPDLTTSEGGSSVSSRNARNSDVPLGVLRCQGCSRVPAPAPLDLPLPAIFLPPESVARRSFTTITRTPLVNDANETTLPISTIRRLQVTALSERFSLSAAVSRVRDSPKNGRHARAFP